MTDEIDDPEQLVPATEVFELLASEYDRKRNGRDWEKAQTDALLAIISRLISGTTFAWASACRIDCSDPRYGSNGHLFDPLDFYVKDTAGRVPIEFWSNFRSAPKGGCTFDEVTGDFRFSFVDEEFRLREGIAQQVFLNRRGLPALAVPSWTYTDQLNPSVPSLNASQSGAQSSNAGGRRPANWWPDFAEELAFYIFEHGLPETQQNLIEAMQLAVASRGKPEPSRSQIQPVVRALFTRIRPVEN